MTIFMVRTNVSLPAIHFHDSSKEVGEDDCMTKDRKGIGLPTSNEARKKKLLKKVSRVAREACVERRDGVVRL